MTSSVISKKFFSLPQYGHVRLLFFGAGSLENELKALAAEDPRIRVAVDGARPAVMQATEPVFWGQRALRFLLTLLLSVSTGGIAFLAVLLWSGSGDDDDSGSLLIGSIPNQTGPIFWHATTTTSISFLRT